MSSGSVGAVSPDRRAFRLTAARNEAPVALTWLAVALAVLSIGQVVVEASGGWLPHLLHAGLVLLFVLAAFVVRSPRVPDAAVPLFTAVAALAVVLVLAAEILRNPTQLGLAYMLVAMACFGVFVLSLPVMLATAILMLVTWVVVVPAAVTDDVLGWLLVGLAAVVVSTVALRVRLGGLDALADATFENATHATRDPLTDMLNRRGIEQRMDELIAVAQRQDAEVFVAFVDVDGLKGANDGFGHDFGDAVLRAVADAIFESVRAADAVGRWGGDEFIVVGLGIGQDPVELRHRIEHWLLLHPVPGGEWHPSVSIGSAHTRPAEDVFVTLLTDADQDMYARRTRERAGESSPGTAAG